VSEETARERRRSRRRKRFRLVGAFLIPVVLLTLAEAALELTAPIPASGYLLRSLRLKENPPSREREARPTDEYLKGTEGLDSGPYVLRTDADGFVEPSFVHDHADHLLVFLGGSTTECLYMAEEARFPYRVGRVLETLLGATVNSVNAGVDGAHSMHSNLGLVAKVLPKKPRAVVLMHCLNDLVTLLYEGGYWNRHKQRSLITARKIQGQVERSSPLRGVRSLARSTFPQLYIRTRALLSAPRSSDEWAHRRGGQLEFDEPEALRAFDRSLRLFVQVCRSHDVVPLLMTQMHRFTPQASSALRRSWSLSMGGLGMEYVDWCGLYTRFNQRIRTVSDQLKVPLVDLERHVHSGPEEMYDFVHLTAKGSERVAQLAAERLATVLR
jgi:hypothetical protein